MKHAITPIANYGDIVRVVGYGDHLFAVDAYTIEYHYEHKFEYCELLYDLSCVYGDSGYVVGEQDDISVVCREAQSAQYLAGYTTQKPTIDTSKIIINYSISEDGVVTLSQPQPPTDRRKQAQKQDEIDGLLDELSDLLMQTELFGETDYIYGEKIARVTGKLKEVTE